MPLSTTIIRFDSKLFSVAHIDMLSLFFLSWSIDKARVSLLDVMRVKRKNIERSIGIFIIINLRWQRAKSNIYWKFDRPNTEDKQCR